MGTSEPTASPGPNDVIGVVLAGGRGTRIQHLLPGLPKPMAPIDGRPFLDWSLRYLASQGVAQVVLSTGHLAEAIGNYFTTHPLPGVEVRIVSESAPLGTAGGFLHAARASGRHPAIWLIANGDSLVLADLAAFIARFRAGPWAGAVLGLQVPDASRYGTIETDATDRLMKFAEKRPGAALVNAGVYLFRDATLARFSSQTPLSFETEVFPRLLAAGVEILVHRVSAPFLDIGTPASLAQAAEFISLHLHPLLAIPVSGQQP